jgi:predicted dehydrogenase/threonine dehydrogenase-like Zn-dependent dehydrogenase
MKQVLHSLKTGTIEVADVPVPAVRPGALLIRTRVSLISSGTERMLVEFGKAGWIEKARQRPDKVRQVLAKIRTDGLLTALEAVRSKLEQPLPLGYCNVGSVISVGERVTGYAVGDRVVSNGWHAEVVSVPASLCAKIPEAVPDDAAAFTVIGAIALQGLRLVQPTLGEEVAVIGLGLVGLLAVQLLRAQGCRVLGVDVLPDRLALAHRFGAETVDLVAGEDPVAAGQAFSRGRGLDAVLIAAATDSSEPVRQAAQMCRKRGRIVLVGAAGLELSRAQFYEKELTFQVSCSYGPGRYDPAYEEKGQDYPVGFVRWTAQRNMEAVVDLVADGRLDVKPLVSHRFPIVEAEKTYELITSSEPSLGIVLEYPAEAPPRESRIVVLKPLPISGSAQAVVSFIGSGNYATSMLIPAFKVSGARLRCVASSGGVSAWHAGRKFGFDEATTDVDRVLADPETTTVVIATRHNTHARLVVEALRAGKHVFVEKPLCVTLDELAEIEAVAGTTGRHLMVGFNRRFARHVDRIRSLLAGVAGPRAFVVTVNAGAVPCEHWTQDPEVGGGRILGEGCHFIDLLRHLAGAALARWARFDLDAPAGDTTNLELVFADGSIGTIHYLANGSKRFPKERLEVFAGGRVLQLDNFRVLRGWGWPGFSRMRLWRQDKGQRACAAAFVRAVEQGGPAPIPLHEILEVSRVTIELAQTRVGRGEG